MFVTAIYGTIAPSGQAAGDFVVFAVMLGIILILLQIGLGGDHYERWVGLLIITWVVLGIVVLSVNWDNIVGGRFDWVP